MSQISQCIQPVTVETLNSHNVAAAKSSLRIYVYFTVLMAMLVILLSSALPTMTRLSDDINQIVKDNDDSARTLHDELQGYILAMVDSRSAQPGMRNLLVNAPSSLALKEHLQTFARKNRQLYSDIQYLNSLWEIVQAKFMRDSAQDLKSRNPYAIGYDAHRYMQSMVVIDPNPLMYENPDPTAKGYPLNIKVDPTSAHYSF